jgi:hypothetical protein
MSEVPKRPWRASYDFAAKRREGISTVLMGLAAVVTTWCAFESTKWGGVQTVRFNRAAAARVESTRNELAGNQILQVDVATFLAWLEAVQAETSALGRAPKRPYRPDPTTLSGFLFQRFRQEFRPAVHAWIEARPLENDAAPPTPFAMPAYARPEIELAHRLSEEAETQARAALEAQRISDAYMLTTVIAALVVFFAGMSSKLSFPANGVALLVLAGLTWVACVLLLLRLPVKIF